MTDNFPDLTVTNVRYWYWLCNPKWSTLDIAKVVGCSYPTVLEFMKKNRIPIRNPSEAGYNAFSCPKKRENILEGLRSEGHRQAQRERILKRWDDPLQRKKLEESNVNFKTQLSRSRTLRLLWKTPQVRKKRIESIALGSNQLMLLMRLHNNGALFLSDFKSFKECISFSSSKLQKSLLGLYKRGYASRKKELNPNTNCTRTFQYKYNITEKGNMKLKLALNKLNLMY